MGALTNVSVYDKPGGTAMITGASGDATNGVLRVLADNPGLDAGDKVYATGDPGFASPATYNDENPSGTLNFKIG